MQKIDQWPKSVKIDNSCDHRRNILHPVAEPQHPQHYQWNLQTQVIVTTAHHAPIRQLPEIVGALKHTTKVNYSRPLRRQFHPFVLKKKQPALSLSAQKFRYLTLLDFGSCLHIAMTCIFPGLIIHRVLFRKTTELQEEQDPGLRIGILDQEQLRILAEPLPHPVPGHHGLQETFL